MLKALSVSTHKFKGFSVPDIGILPPEFYEVMPLIQTVTELKVTIAALRHALQFGSAEIPYSLEDFVAATGLTKWNVLRGIRKGITRQTLIRIPFGKSFVYRLNFRGSQNETPCMHASLHTTSHATTLHARGAASRKMSKKERATTALAERISKLGVATRVALDIVRKHDAAKLKRHIAYTEHAVKERIAHNSAAWFVASVRDDWGPPLGYVSEEKKKFGWWGKEHDQFVHR